MAEVIGLGCTHYPPLAGSDENMADILRWTLEDPAIPAEHRDTAGWPEQMRAEYGPDGGAASAAAHRMALVDGLHRVRGALDEFDPDVVVVWGDDQYENFREEVVPAFAVLAFEDIKFQPWSHGRMNVWHEDPNTVFEARIHRQAAKSLTSSLLEHAFDVAYAYRPRDGAPFPHAFANSLLYLDYERQGFPYALVPVAVNCYGRHVIARRGGLSRFADSASEELEDPPSPSPRRCLELGAAVGRWARASKWRVALLASSSWSHAFLHDKAWRLYPDHEADRHLYHQLEVGNYDAWEQSTLAEVERAGQQEILNWFCLVGAARELGLAPRWTTLVETHVFNSNKCFAVLA